MLGSFEWGRCIRPVVDGILDILQPQAVIAGRRRGGGVASQVLGGGQTGVGDHVAQDGQAEIVPDGEGRPAFFTRSPKILCSILGVGF